MIINKEELVKTLSLLKPGLNKKEISQQTCHFVFADNQIFTYNGKICIMHPFACEEEFSIRGEEFYRLISGISEEEIEITMITSEKKGKRIKIKSDSTNSEMAVLAEDQKTVITNVEKLQKGMGKWKKLPEDFLEAISLCHFSTSPDLTTDVKACIHFEKNKAYSSDNYRISIFALNDSLDTIINIPGKSAVELINFPVVEYCFSNEWICFRTEEDVVFCCSTINGSFPTEKAEKIFASLEELSTIELPSEDMKQLISDVLILATDESNAGKIVFVRLSNNELFIKTENELGFIEKVMDVDYESEEVSFKINSKLFVQILDKSCEMYIGENVLFFITNNFQHALGLIK